MKILVFVVLFLMLLAIGLEANADNTNASALSSSSGGAGGAGGNASSIGQGGMGGLGGAGGMGGNGYGGEGGNGGTAYGGAGGIGQGGAASNAGNSQSASMHFDQVRQSPAVFMSAPMPTSPCQATLGGFLSFIGGVGVAGSRTLRECELRELSRSAHAIGQPELAKFVLCKAEEARDFEGCQN